MEKQGWKNLCIIFIILFVLVGLYGWWLSQILENSDSNYKSQQEYYEKNYEYKCGEGFKRECITIDSDAVVCGKGQKGYCFDFGAYPQDMQNCKNYLCITSGTKYTTCSESNEKAVCVNSLKESVWNGNWISECQIGYTATCIKQ